MIMSDTVAGGPLESQLDFYRHKANQHEQERVEWQEQTDLVRQQIERVHGSELQAAKLREEIAELQKKLSDAHLSIYDERISNMQLNREVYLLESQARNNK
jgi:predicted RNase H-like nuclease (RuvC/YqgF family)